MSEFSQAETIDPRVMELLGGEGPWTCVYVDGPGALPQVEEEAYRESVKERLAEAGAPTDDIAAVDAALSSGNDLPSPSARIVLASGGRVEWDQGFVGARLGPELIHHGPVPLIVPLLRHLSAATRYLVVETSRDGADIRLETSGRGASDARTEIDGSTETLTKVQAGGMAHANYQRRTENIWKHNQAEVATAVSALIREQHPVFVAVSGDVRARGLLAEALSDTERALIVDVDSHTRPEGAESAALDEAIAVAIAERHADRIADVRDHAEADNGSAGAQGVRDVTAALQQARVNTLLLDARMLDDESTLVALDAAPWVVADESERLGTGVVGSVPAVTALVRAAVLTDARVLIEEDEPAAHDAPRDDRPVREPLASLRWTHDPEADQNGAL